MGMGTGVSGYGSPEFRPATDRAAQRVATAAAELQAARDEREGRLRPELRPDESAAEAWQAARSWLAENAGIPATTLALWIEPFECIGVIRSSLALEAPSAVLNWSERRYANLIGNAVREASEFDGTYLLEAK